MDFETAQGDVAEQSAAALVNAAGTSLRMGSGVAGALLDAADGPLEADAREKGPVDLGEAVVTDAPGLDAEYVVHAAVVPHGGVRERATGESIRRGTANALAAADDRGCRSIVVPLLGCGNGGFYAREGAEIVCSAIREYEPDALDDARVLAYTDRELTALEEAADAVRE